MDQSSPQRSEPPFYAVGLRKLALLWLATLGFYQLLWFFQHWRHLRDAGGQRVHPAARSLLAFIFVFPLAWRIGKAAEVWRTGNRIRAVLAAVVWVPLSFCAARLPQGPLLLLGFLAMVPILSLQRMANRVNRAVAPLADANTTLTRANLVIVVIGGLLLLASTVGLFLPDSEVTVEEQF